MKVEVDEGVVIEAVNKLVEYAADLSIFREYIVEAKRMRLSRETAFENQFARIEWCRHELAKTIGLE